MYLYFFRMIYGSHVYAKYTQVQREFALKDKKLFIVIYIYNQLFVFQRDKASETVSKSAQNKPEDIQVDTQMALQAMHKANLVKGSMWWQPNNIKI